MMGWLRLHRHALAESARRLAAQPLAAAFSVLVLGFAIALPVIAAMALRTLGAATSGIDAEPHVNVYLTLDAGTDDARRVEAALRADPASAAVRFIPRDEAFNELKSSTHLGELLASLDRNPLPHAFSVRVRTDDAAQLERVRSAWSKLPKVDQVAADFEWAQRLGRWMRFADRLLAILAAILGAAVAFIVGHLIRLQVVSRREEIEVSQLIGATASDVRRPFLYHGLIEGGLAGICALLLASGLGWWAGSELAALTPSYAPDLRVIFLGWPAAAALVASAGILGALGAWWAVGRELRQFSPSSRNL
jgi:cell division transport system permease protein